MTDNSTWSHGYPVGSAYPASFHGFQSPAHLRMICALQGVVWEVDEHTPLSIAEVGCGSGYTAQMLAAGGPNWQVLGLDYNPAHIAQARSFAAAAGLGNLQFLEADLAEMDEAACDRLPEFDLITVHGVWSWVADAVRDGLLRLIRRRLKPGGLALVTYNALPGAAQSLGLSRLVRGCLDAADGETGLAQAGDLVRRLVETEAVHLPNSAWRQMLMGQYANVRPGYLLHEFSTAHWRPSFQADVAQAMATARCDFVGSATIDENFPQMSLSPPQIELWQAAPDAATRELIFDLCVPRPFRRDLYVRGLRREAAELATDALWLAEADRTPGERVLKTQLGEARLPPAVVDSAMAALSCGPQQVAQLRQLPGCGKVTPAELVALLVGSGCAVPLWRQPGSGADWTASVAAARRLNRIVGERLAPYGLAMGQFGLATPALGGGLRVTPQELAIARSVADRQAAGQALTVEAIVGDLIPPGPRPPTEVLADMADLVQRTLVHKLPAWQTLGIV